MVGAGLTEGDRHRERDAAARLARAAHELWRGVRDDFEVGWSHCEIARADNSRHPDELYINGIQRESFIPAIDLIKERFEVVDLDSGTGELPLIRTALSHARLPQDPPGPIAQIGTASRRVGV